MLPKDYLSLVPGDAVEVFKKEKFEWKDVLGGKGVPEWIPPVELR
jgi:hypothetical protein